MAMATTTTMATATAAAVAMAMAKATAMATTKMNYQFTKQIMQSADQLELRTFLPVDFLTTNIEEMLSIHINAATVSPQKRYSSLMMTAD